MEIVDGYAQRKVDEELKKKLVLDLIKKGFSLDEITETAGVSIDFIKETIEGLGINLKIIEYRVQRIVEDSLKPVIINLDGEGFEMGEIARIMDVDFDFVKETLSE